MKIVRALIIASCLLAGCQLTQTGEVTPTPTESPTLAATEETTAEATAALVADTTQEANPFATPTGAPRVTAAPSDVLLGGVLAWIGARDVASRTGRTGQVVLISTDGTVSPLLEAPDTGRPASMCGERSISPDGKQLAFYVGGDRGTLYIMQGAQPPVALSEIEYLACLGMGAFRYSPDGGRFAVLDYVPGAARNDFAAGTLRIYDSTSLAQVASFEGAVAYELGNTDAIFLRFFANGQGIADEAAVVLWNGSDEREIATIVPTEQGCRFTSGQVVRAGSNPIVLMGQRCTRSDAGTRWQLYTINGADGSVTLANSDSQPGAFVTFARTNNLIPSPDGRTVYFTVPDGVAAYTVAVAAINLADMSITIPVERQAVFPNFSGTVEATPRFSPDGRWLVMVVTSPDNDNQLLAVDLNDPVGTPIAISAGSRGDTIPAFAFGESSSRLYYVGGGEDNALYSLDLSSGTESRIVRGRFGVAMAVQGNQIAVLDTRREENPPAVFFDLVLVNADNAAKHTIYEGQPIAGGGSTYAVPIAWR